MSNLEQIDDWRWLLEPGTNALQICLGNKGLYTCRVESRVLQQALPDNQLLSIEQLDTFHIFKQSLSSVFNDIEECIHLALDALAYCCYAKPKLPKSWFFVPSIAQLMLAPGMLVELDTVAGVSGLFMILTTDDKISQLFYVGSQPLLLTDGQQLAPNAVIRVMNNCVARYGKQLGVQSLSA